MGPLIGPGCEGVEDTETLRVWGVLVPQSLLAVTEITPPVAPTVAETEVEPCPPSILHPDGNVQV